PMLFTTISVPRVFIPASQLFSKPRDMPTRATTAAMPMEIPTRVRPVRTGRRSSPRMTTVRRVMLVLSQKVHGVAVRDNPPILHLYGASVVLGVLEIVRDHHEGHLPLAMELFQQIENHRCILAIQVAGGFVCKQD